jgi:hypothetical protein
MAAKWLRLPGREPSRAGQADELNTRDEFEMYQKGDKKDKKSKNRKRRRWRRR